MVGFHGKSGFSPKFHPDSMRLSNWNFEAYYANFWENFCQCTNASIAFTVYLNQITPWCAQIICECSQKLCTWDEYAYKLEPLGWNLFLKCVWIEYARTCTHICSLCIRKRTNVPEHFVKVVFCSSADNIFDLPQSVDNSKQSPQSSSNWMNSEDSGEFKEIKLFNLNT